MTVDKLTVPFEDLRIFIDISRELIPKFEEIFYALKPEVDELALYIENVSSQLDNPPPITIALLGSTGAGKSTLINRIVGADVLPNSGSKVCTAGITRLRYLDSPEFKITITFTSKDSWQKEIEVLSGSQFESIETKQATIEPKLDFKKLQSTREERERLIAVYGRNIFNEFLATRDFSLLQIPPKVNEAFNNQQRVLSADNPEKALSLAKEFLVTTSSDQEGLGNDQLWPIVETVLIEGRFEAIRHGSEIVDLPGLNDPNPAREARTLEYLKIAKFIFIAYESKRQPTKDIREVLKSRDLMSTIISSGKTNALTFIATKIDDFSDDDQDFSHFGEDEPNEVLALYRKKLVGERMATALIEIAEEAAAGAETEKEKDLIKDSIAGSKKFITSAQDYSLLLKRQSGKKSRTQPKFEHVTDTEIPTVREHVNELTLRVGPYVVFTRIHNDVLGIVNQMQMIMNLEFARFIMQHDKFTEKSEALQKRITEITEDLDILMKSLSKNFQETIEEKSKDFFLRIGKGANAAPRIQREIRNFIRGLHWMTARATTRRGGRFYSSSRDEFIDLISEVSTPIIETITHPWSTFFGSSLQDILEMLQVHLTKAVDDFVVKVRHSVGDRFEVSELELVIKTLLTNVDEVSQSRIQMAKDHFNAEVESTRSLLIELIRDCVEKKLTPVIYRASEHFGSGMKLRMTDEIVEAVGDVVPRAFEDAHKEIERVVTESMERVQTLIDGVAKVVIADGRKIERLFAKIENVEQLFDEVSARKLKVEVDSLQRRIDATQLSVVELDDEEVLSPVQEKPLLILDGSNVATEMSLKNEKIASLAVLMSCKAGIEREFPGHDLVIFVDATFKYDIPFNERAKLQELEISKIITRTAGGVQADPIILKLATKRKARIVSKDRYRDWVKSYPIIAEPGRIVVPTFVASEDDWIFQSRTRI